MRSIVLSASYKDGDEMSNGAKESVVLEAILAQVRDYLAASGLRVIMRPAQVPPAAVASIANRERASFLFCLSANGREPCGVCYHPQSQAGKRCADLVLERLELIIPEGKAFKRVASPQLPDFRMAKCPCVHLCFGEEKDAKTAEWLVQSVGVIAHALARALTAWFDLPCQSPFARSTAKIAAPQGALALRCLPSEQSERLLSMKNGADVLLFHREGEWQYIECEGVCGFAKRQYLRIAES
ncbi:MAG: hypothetical protein LBB67_02485 [Oscillospiraceae bacterium]|jgi:hypothetical protein|nr:hypothetical protein [Oscillospiraceae bacterium]